jgi:hypothetical protein
MSSSLLGVWDNFIKLPADAGGGLVDRSWIGRHQHIPSPRRAEQRCWGRVFVCSSPEARVLCMSLLGMGQ